MKIEQKALKKLNEALKILEPNFKRYNDNRYHDPMARELYLSIQTLLEKHESDKGFNFLQ